MSRTYIHLDEALVREGLKITGLRSKKALVEFALRELVKNADKTAILALEGRYRWESDLAESRKPRFAPSRN